MIMICDAYEIEFEKVWLHVLMRKDMYKPLEALQLC